jgi:hypothetical protein
MLLMVENILEFERGSTKSHSVEDSLLEESMDLSKDTQGYNASFLRDATQL